jgi:uncharacterized membrane protein
MKHFSRSIVIHAPVRNVYNQWTQFEDFPKFLGCHCIVRQLDSMSIMWRARVWGKRVKWRMVIYEQVPDRYVAWRSARGGPHHGAITFESIDGDTTRVVLTVTYQPVGLFARLWTRLGALEWHVGRSLKRFRRFIELRSFATGGWRGRIHDGVLLGGPTLSHGAPQPAA